jgi:hypothetical protein
MRYLLRTPPLAVVPGSLSGRQIINLIKQIYCPQFSFHSFGSRLPAFQVSQEQEILNRIKNRHGAVFDIGSAMPSTALLPGSGRLKQ